MANTIATCVGRDRSRTKEDHRLGSESSTGYAATWQTKTECHVNRDGSGYVRVVRNNVTLLDYPFGPENEGNVPFLGCCMSPGVCQHIFYCKLDPKTGDCMQHTERKEGR